MEPNPFTCQKVKRRSLTLGLMTMIGSVYGLYFVEPELMNLAIAGCVSKHKNGDCLQDGESQADSDGVCHQGHRGEVSRTQIQCGW